MPTPGDEITNGLKQITSWVETWAVPLGAIGVVSMACLQAAKSILPLRTRFQRKHIRIWLHERSQQIASAEEDLIKLATDGDGAAFYNSEIEDVCQRIKAAVPVILDYPDKHTDLLRLLASEADEADVALLLSPPPVEVFYRRGDESADEDKKKVKAFAEAKARVTTQVHCAIDAIQSSIQYRWKYWLQLSSFFLSALIGGLALLLGAAPGQSGGSRTMPTVGGVFIIAILSGFLAPVARDLVAAIEKWRT